MEDFSKEIRAYALKNAIEFGKAEAKKILPKLFQHGLKKEDIQEIMPQVIKIVEEINSLSATARANEFKQLHEFVKEKPEEKERELPELPNAVRGEVVTRLAPEPSKYNHLGHAVSFVLNYLYAKKYDGKCLLRFEDANPEKVSQEYVDAMMSDVIDYLGIKIDGVRYVSNDMAMLYGYAEELIKLGEAYMCFCKRDKMQDLRHAGKECKCRINEISENFTEWKKFLNGKYMKGEASLRLKGDMKSLNHVMRDPVIFRAVKAKHYKYGEEYKVWPMYDFYNAIEDSIMEVTHILRSNEFDLRIELQDYIKKLLGLRKQTIVQYGRINVIEYTTKGREVRELVESGKYMGWDDPRLMTLRALRRRGITKEAIYELVNELGLKQSQANLEFDMIASINRKIIDPIANRYSFVKNPVELKIANMPRISEIEVPVHPDKQELKKVKIADKIFISEEDFKKLKGKRARLIHLYNIELDNRSGFASSEIEEGIPKINWVSESVNAKVLMPDGKWVSGLAEKGVEDLEEGQIIQFERFGFVRFDNVNDKGEYEFWFAHK